MNKITIIFFLGAIIFSLSKDYNLELINFSANNLEGFVVSEISETNKLQSFIFETYGGDKYLLRTDKYLNYFYGDKISISGKLEIPKNFENENGIIFNYQKYLLKDNITHIIFYPTIQILEKESKKDFKFYIFKFKNYLTSNSKKIFTSETSSLVLGVLLGVKDSIDENLENNFRRTGLIHILVLSGFNLTIIAYFVFKTFSSFHRNIRFLSSLFFILIFVIMVGAGATVVRAGIMISIFILSKLFYRNSNPLNALIIAGSIMIFLNPVILLYDPSFQLSFVATLGLVSFYQIIEKILFFLPNRLSIKEIIISNIAVQITVVPLLIYLMGEFSIISLIPNILILPIIPIFMLVSFLAICVSYVSGMLAFPLITITEILSNIIVYFVNLFGDLSFSIIKVGAMPLQLLLIFILFYLSLVLFLDFRRKFISKLRYSYLQSWTS